MKKSDFVLGCVRKKNSTTQTKKRNNKHINEENLIRTFLVVVILPICHKFWLVDSMGEIFVLVVGGRKTLTNDRTWPPSPSTDCNSRHSSIVCAKSIWHSGTFTSPIWSCFENRSKSKMAKTSVLFIASAYGRFYKINKQMSHSMLGSDIKLLIFKLTLKTNDSLKTGLSVFRCTLVSNFFFLSGNK